MKSFELLHQTVAQYENKPKGKNVSVVTIIPRQPPGSSSSRSASRDGRELKKQVTKQLEKNECVGHSLLI
jgi:hypothetical protein